MYTAGRGLARAEDGAGVHRQRRRRVLLSPPEQHVSHSLLPLSQRERERARARPPLSSLIEENTCLVPSCTPIPHLAADTAAVLQNGDARALFKPSCSASTVLTLPPPPQSVRESERERERRLLGGSLQLREREREIERERRLLRGCFQRLCFCLLLRGCCQRRQTDRQTDRVQREGDRERGGHLEVCGDMTFMRFFFLFQTPP